MRGASMHRAAFFGFVFAASIAAVAAAERAPLAFERGFETVRLAAIPKGTPYDGCVLALDVDPRARRNARVYTLCPGGGDPLLAFLRETDPGAVSLLPRASGDGALEVWVGFEGALEIWRQAGREAAIEVVARLEDPRIGPLLREEDRPDLDGDGSADFIQGHFEGVTTWRRAGGTFVELAHATVPPSAVLVLRRVVVRTPPLLSDGSGKAGDRFTAPEPRPGDRWRVHRVRVGEAGGTVDVCPAWIDLAKPLDIRSATIANGTTPRLVALAQPGDRMALLGELDIVVAPLECRRSGRGTGFERTVATKHANYSPGSIRMRDVTGDGLDDALVLGTTGRFDADPFVTVLVREPGGAFAPRPITWKGDAEDFETALYSWDADADGDGLDDLLYLHEGSTLAVVPGVEADGKAVPLARKPARLVALPLDIDPVGTALVIARDGRRWLVYVGTRAKKGGKSETLLVTVPL